MKKIDIAKNLLVSVMFCNIIYLNIKITEVTDSIKEIENKLDFVKTGVKNVFYDIKTIKTIHSNQLKLKTYEK